MGRASSRKKAQRAARMAAPARRPRHRWRWVLVVVVLMGAAVASVVLFAGDVPELGS